MCHRGTINGIFCTDILVATKTLVRKQLVSNEDILDGETTIRSAQGDIVSYPLAVVKITIGGQDIITQAAVSTTLPASALLGWDVPQVMNLVDGSHPGDGLKEDAVRDQKDALVVLIRSRRKQQETDARERAKHDIQPNHWKLSQLPPQRLKKSCLILMILSSPLQVVRKPPSHGHRSVATGAAIAAEGGIVRPEDALDISADGLRALQDEDETLRRARTIANEDLSAAAGEVFFRREGLL